MPVEFQHQARSSSSFYAFFLLLGCCLCAVAGVLEVASNLVLLKENVPLKARNGYGYFDVPLSLPSVQGFRLVYQSGSVSCGSGWSPFGCGGGYQYYAEIITYSNNEIIVPSASDPNVTFNPGWNLYKFYRINGRNEEYRTDRKEFSLYVFPPIALAEGTQLRLYYSEVLNGNYPQNNVGVSYVNIYGIIDSKTMELPAGATTAPVAKIAQNICYSAKNESEFGAFAVPLTFSRFYGFRLVYRGGSVGCVSGKTQNFGCDNGDSLSLGEVITFSNKSIVVPSIGDPNISFFCGLSCGFYRIEGRNETIRPDLSSFTLFLNPGFSPLLRGSEFRLYYAEALSQHAANDNSGTTCVDILGIGEVASPSVSVPRRLSTVPISRNEICVSGRKNATFEVKEEIRDVYGFRITHRNGSVHCPSKECNGVEEKEGRDGYLGCGCAYRSFTVHLFYSHNNTRLVPSFHDADIYIPRLEWWEQFKMYRSNHTEFQNSSTEMDLFTTHPIHFKEVPILIEVRFGDLDADVCVDIEALVPVTTATWSGTQSPSTSTVGSVSLSAPESFSNSDSSSGSFSHSLCTHSRTSSRTRSRTRTFSADDEKEKNTKVSVAAKAMGEAIGDETATSVESASGSGAWASGVAAMPTVAAYANRMQLLVGGVECSIDDVSLDPSWLEGIPLSLGSSEYRNLSGSCFLTSVVCIGLLFTCDAFSRIFAQRNCKSKIFSWLVRGVSLLYCTALQAFAGSVTQMSITIIIHGSDILDKTFGSVSLALLCMQTMWLAYRLVLCFDAIQEIDAKTDSENDGSRIKLRLRFQSKNPERLLFVEGYGALFEATRDVGLLRMRLYFLEELITSVLLGIVSGIHPNGKYCHGIAVGLLLVSVLHFAYVCCVRPFRTFIETGFSFLFALNQIAIGVLSIVAISHESFLEPLGYAVLIQSFSLLLQVLCQWTWTFILFLHRMKHQSVAAKGSSSFVNGTSSSSGMLSIPYIADDGGEDEEMDDDDAVPQVQQNPLNASRYSTSH